MVLPAAVSVSGGMWERADTLVLADSHCRQCHGLGIVWKKQRTAPCRCVYREVFRLCYQRYLVCEFSYKPLTRLDYSWVQGRARVKIYGRKPAEYCADFCLIARRELSGLDWRVFQLRFLEQLDWQSCARILKIERGMFFQRAYAVKEVLGRVFRELKPYALFPLDEYFSSAEPNRMQFRDPPLIRGKWKARDNTELSAFERRNGRDRFQKGGLNEAHICAS